MVLHSLTAVHDTGTSRTFWFSVKDVRDGFASQTALDEMNLVMDDNPQELEEDEGVSLFSGPAPATPLHNSIEDTPRLEAPSQFPDYYSPSYKDYTFNFVCMSFSSEPFMIKTADKPHSDNQRSPLPDLNIPLLGLLVPQPPLHRSPQRPRLLLALNPHGTGHRPSSLFHTSPDDNVPITPSPQSKAPKAVIDLNAPQRRVFAPLTPPQQVPSYYMIKEARRAVVARDAMRRGQGRLRTRSLTDLCASVNDADGDEFQLRAPVLAEKPGQIKGRKRSRSKGGRGGDRASLVFNANSNESNLGDLES
ncbi:hypothetical protein C8R45DRAFT_1100234 [Mycena sanguinolenta]|nr:hypothetical protein C8R45DRAFT_1100234 [Mycena sanguinolenta]